VKGETSKASKADLKFTRLSDKEQFPHPQTSEKFNRNMFVQAGGEGRLLHAVSAGQCSLAVVEAVWELNPEATKLKDAAGTFRYFARAARTRDRKKMRTM